MVTIPDVSEPNEPSEDIDLVFGRNLAADRLRTLAGRWQHDPSMKHYLHAEANRVLGVGPMDNGVESGCTCDNCTTGIISKYL